MANSPLPSASTDHAALDGVLQTVRYLEPAEPFEVDEHGLPVAATEPDDPDDE